MQSPFFFGNIIYNIGWSAKGRTQFPIPDRRTHAQFDSQAPSALQIHMTFLGNPIRKCGLEGLMGNVHNSNLLTKPTTCPPSVNQLIDTEKQALKPKQNTIIN